MTLPNRQYIALVIFMIMMVLLTMYHIHITQKGNEHDNDYHGRVIKEMQAIDITEELNNAEEN